MPKENELTAINTVTDVDKVRVVTSTGLSQSIEVGHLKSSLSVDDLPGRVATLETRANTNDTDHTDMSSDIALLKSTVGERAVEGGTTTNSGLFQEISNIRSEIATLHLGEVDRLDSELDVIRADLTSINGTNGRLDVLTDTKLDQSAFQDAVAEGFKIIRKTPASASAAGQPGEVCWDTTYFYVCVGVNTWKRISLEDW